MSGGQQVNNQPPSSTWTEPPWSGWIETTGDALLILEAARRGLIPRVTRRLVDSERKMITSGSVFVFDEDESGIKRWTDGFFWSPSRILGNFLLYRETDKRGSGHHRGGRSEPSSTSADGIDTAQYNADGVKVEGQSLSRPKTDGGQMGIDKHRERTLMGSLTNSYKFKPEGLMKKTFSLSIGGVSQHLISYYRIEDVENGRLRSPSSLPELASLDISPEYLDKTHFRNPPKVEVGADGIPRYRGEADDIDAPPSMMTAPLSSGLPLLSDGRIAEGSKRAKRFDPYGSPVPSKRRKQGKTSQDNSSPTDEPTAHPPQPSHLGYVDPGTAAVSPPQHPPYGVHNYYQAPPGYATMPPHPHLYPPPVPVGYPPPTNGSPAPGQQSPPQQGTIPQPVPPQYTYPGYPTQLGAPAAADPTQSGQPYYPYYPPPPPGTYPGYLGSWPHYAGYPPQSQAQPPTQGESRHPEQGNEDGEEGDDDS